MGYTFADELIMRGFHLTSDTVLFDASNLTQEFEELRMVLSVSCSFNNVHSLITLDDEDRFPDLPDDWKPSSKKIDGLTCDAEDAGINSMIDMILSKPIMPPFQRTLWSLIYKPSLQSGIGILCTPLMYSDNESIGYIFNGITLFEEQCGFSTIGYWIEVESDGKVIDHGIAEIQPDGQVHTQPRPINFETKFLSPTSHAMLAMSLLSNKTANVDLVTPSRAVRRNHKRKYGKTPSPYFLLQVNLNEQLARYGITTKPSDDAQAKRRHLVRGHFRTTQNHPIAQFNGTRFIPAHFRGDLTAGEVKKGYTIVLD